MAEIKKTYEGAVAYLETLVGKPFTEKLFNKFVEEFALKTSRTNTPREAVRLYDANGNVLAKKCSIFGKWLLADHFRDATKSSASNEAKKLKKALVDEANAIRKEAEAILLDARSVEDPQEKLDLFSKYDEELQRASEVENTSIECPEDIECFESVEEVAEHLGVDVITENPLKDAGN